MAGSRTSVFGEAEDFQAALSSEGVVGILFTGRGQFRARLTQIDLEQLRLAAVQEAQSRVAFLEVPGGAVSVSFPVDGGPSPVWGGIEIHTGEIVTFGPGQRLHARTVGPCRWGAIQLPAQQLADYGRAVIGTKLVIPSAARWRPRRGAATQLRDLHRAAIRMAEARQEALTDVLGAHGLEQQLLEALIECLADGAEEETASRGRHRDILARFEDHIAAEPMLLLAQICAALKVSARLLRECSKSHLGMGPSRYRQLTALQKVYRALRRGVPDGANITQIARHHGFRDLGRLAAIYKAVYGELPSATLRRRLHPGISHLKPRRRRGLL